MFLGIHQGPIRTLLSIFLTPFFGVLAIHAGYTQEWWSMLLHGVWCVFFGFSFYFGIDYYQLVVPAALPLKLYKIGETYFVGSSNLEAQLFAEIHKIPGLIEEVSDKTWIFHNNIID